ncbi:hypothetical protein CsSME_00023590 [Camellia sinensis var. sinensis]
MASNMGFGNILMPFSCVGPYPPICMASLLRNRFESWGKMADAVIEVEDDDDFLAQVATLEADALSSKRRKTTATTTTTTSAAVTRSSINAAAAEESAEGAYTAALRGSRSLLFQQQSSRSNGGFKVLNNNNNMFANPGFAGGGGTVGGGGVDSCFKCGKSGHWSRDCDTNLYGVVDPSVPEKACPCGLGACIVLTANTEKNRGRQFYKCPLRENYDGANLARLMPCLVAEKIFGEEIRTYYIRFFDVTHDQTNPYEYISKYGDYMEWGEFHERGHCANQNNKENIYRDALAAGSKDEALAMGVVLRQTGGLSEIAADTPGLESDMRDAPTQTVEFDPSGILDNGQCEFVVVLDRFPNPAYTPKFEDVFQWSSGDPRTGCMVRGTEIDRFVVLRHVSILMPPQSTEYSVVSRQGVKTFINIGKNVVSEFRDSFASATNLDASSVVSLDNSELLDPASLTDGPMSTGPLGWVLGPVLINNGRVSA